MIKLISQNYRRINIKNNIIKQSITKSDIILGQEIILPLNEKEKELEINKIEQELNVKIFHSSKINGAHIIIIVKNALIEYIKTQKELIPGRALLIKIQNDEYKYNIVNIYAPSGNIIENSKFCKDLFKIINNISNVIIIGDWNSVIKDNMCNKGRNSDHKKLSKLIENDFKNYQDIHETINTNNKYTYTKGKYRARLDRAYISESNIQAILQYKIKLTTFSDHDQIQLTLKWGERITWGKGNWKLNTQLLKDEEYNKQIKNNLEIYKLNKQFYHPMEGWDILKRNIKTTSIQYATEKHKNQKCDLEKLQEKLQNIIIEIDNETECTDTLIEMKRQLEQEIEQIEKDKYEGNRIRAKIEKIKHDEKSTKYFFRKEKTTGQNKNIIILENENEENIEGKDNILKETEMFYKKLYQSTGTNQTQTNENLNHLKNTLNEDDQRELNEYFTTKEIEQVIKEMKNEKSPGDDGIPKEFYEHFFNDMKEILTELFNNILLSNTMPNSHKNAIIKLIYKKNDQKQLKNWRPISLLNVDYKILSKLLTKRFSKIMNKIIPIEQKCGVKNRKLTDIIRNLDTYIKHSNNGYIILLDQTKAFDRVNHQYLFTVLQKLGIKGNIYNVIKEMYNNITSQIEINGANTNKIKIERGVRQGCPFSMLLFVVSTIPLIEMIKDSPNITGHTTKLNRKIKIQSYADDTTIIIKSPKELQEIEKIFAKHAIASEAEINTEKTEIFRLGKPRNDENEAFKDKIKKKVKILGAIFCENRKNETKENLITAIEKLQNWNENYTQYITIVGKILRINTYIYTTIFNNAWIIDTEDIYFKKLIDEIGKYLQKLKHSTVYELVSRRKNEGGLNLINIKERIIAIKAKEIIEAIDNTPETDNIIYELSTNQRKIYKIDIKGPRAEYTPHKLKQIIKTIEPKIEIIRNYKKRHKKLETKALEKILFSKQTINNYQEIIQSDEPKLIEINYKIKHQILPVTSYINCYLCNSHPEEIEHLVVECKYLTDLRNQVNRWLEIINKPKLDKDRIINMTNVNDELENQIISRYKNTIWMIRNNIKNTGKKQTVHEIIKILDNDIQFYINHIRKRDE